jgi:AraC-like DNA-binding protein
MPYFKRIKPCAKLHHIVKSFLIMEQPGISAETEYLASSDVSMKISGRSAFLSGPFTCPARVFIPESDFGFAMIFHPGRAYELFGIPVTEFRDRALNLEDVIGPGVKTLLERIGYGSNCIEKMSVVESFLTDLVDKNGSSERIDTRHLACFFDGSNGTVNDIAGDLGISSRHLQRIINERIGVNPALFRRLLRFEKAVDLIHTNGTWADIAYECGYSDQSHFIRDFKEFSGHTPSDYRALQSSISWS